MEGGQGGTGLVSAASRAQSSRGLKKCQHFSLLCVDLHVVTDAPELAGVEHFLKLTWASRNEGKVVDI